MERLFRFLRSSRGRRSILLALLWAAMAGLLFAVQEVLLPFFVAGFLAYVIQPPVRWLAGRRLWRTRQLGRLGGVLVIYLGFFAVLWLAAVFLIPRIANETVRMASWTAEEAAHTDQRLDALAARTTQMFADLGVPVVVVNSGASDEVDIVAGPETATPPIVDDRVVVDLALIARDAFSEARDLLDPKTGVRIASRLQQLFGGLIGGVFQFFLVLMLTAFILADTDRIKRFFFTVVPIEDRKRYDNLLERMDHGLSGVVRGQITICIVNGVLTLIGLLLFQVKYAFVLAAIAAIFSLIPIFGSILSTLPIVTVALLNAGPLTAVGVLVWIVGIHLLEANLLNPKIMGDAAKIHPALIVLALVAGEHFYGIAGALFAVPIASIGLTLFRSAHARATELEDDLDAQGTPPWRRRPKRPMKVRVFRDPR